MYKYGIVSTASITKRFIDGLRLADDEVICIGSRDKEKAKQFALDNNINKYYGSYEEVYEDKDIDIVYIPVINNLHYECAKQALLHKKNVVLEKPFTLTVDEAKELYALAKSNNCFLFEGVKNLFVPSTKFVQEHLKDIGDVTNITTAQGIKKPFPKGHWMHDISKGGGAFIGSMSYVFHYLRKLFNSELSDLDGTYVLEENADIITNFHFYLNNIKVESVIDMSKDLDNTCVIYGTKGKITINEFWRSHHVLVELNNGNKYEFDDEGNEFVYEARHIHECLDKKLLQSPIINEEDSIKEVETITYLYKKWKMI